jgi:DNA-binding transcriptional ArsR family regulator
MSPATQPKRDPLGVLGDTNRRTIVQLLGRGDRSVQELADSLPISRPAVSRHLRLLKEAGLVSDQSEGARNIFHLEDEGLEQILHHLAELWGNAASRFRIAVENTSSGSDRGTG